MAFNRRGMRRRSSFGSSGRPYKPSRVWLPLAGTPLYGVSETTASSLYSLQAPTVSIGTALTADPPEDVTILRVMADFSFALSTAGAWILALTVQDTAWTPSGTFELDGDKRFLWTRTYVNLQAGTPATYHPPGMLDNGAGVIGGDLVHATHLDIAPKVRVEAGKALYLVAYEQSGTATVTCTLYNFRMLYQQSGRR